MNTVDVSLLEYQYDFLMSTSKETLLLGGVGSGKTHTGAHFVINMVANYPGSKGLITANVYSQLVNATIQTLIAELERLGIPYESVLSGAKKHIKIYDTIIYLYSLEKYDNIRGIEVGWAWNDESLFCSKEEAFKVIRGRLRDKHGPLLIRHTSSPNGYNWAYDKFENMDGSNKSEKIHLVRAKTEENIFLPEGYYEDLLEDYGGADNPLARQELNGEFVDMTAGAVYWAFERDIHVQPCSLDEDFPVYVGIDFNVNNMTACYVQYRNGTFYICEEVVLDNYGANTDSMATRVCKDLKSRYQVLMVPDSTGKAVKSSSRGRSDLEILKSYGLEVKKTRNPFIRDRQNCLNIHFKKNSVIINKSCKSIIKELGTLSSREKEGDKAHVSVALGYVAWAIAPLRTRPRSTWH